MRKSKQGAGHSCLPVLTLSYTACVLNSIVEKTRATAFQKRRNYCGSTRQKMLPAVWKDLSEWRGRNDAQVKGYILSEGRDVDVTMILSMKNWQTAWTRKEDLSWMQLKK